MHPLHPWMAAQQVEARHRALHSGVSDARRAQARLRSWATRTVRSARTRVEARRPAPERGRPEWEEPWSTCGAISTSRH